MYYAYILRSEKSPDQTYVGLTSDLRKRLAEHNAGKSIHTQKVKPWDLIGYVGLPEEHLSERFQTYMKSGGGAHLRSGAYWRTRRRSPKFTATPILASRPWPSAKGANFPQIVRAYLNPRRCGCDAWCHACLEP
jgi:putative endonuclease